jgi:ATP-dependent protease ClpP protease subunit
MSKRPREWFKIEVKALAEGKPDLGDVADISVYDEIGPSFCGEPAVNASSFVAALDALPTSVKTLRVHVNSPGGDVWDAVTIANRLKAQREEKGRTVEVLIEGLAASAATIISSAGAPVRIADNALMMVHNPRAGGRGDAKEIRKAAEMLDAVKGQIVATYRWVSNKTAEELSEMMDAETWMDAAQAVAAGFAHEVMPGVQVTASLREGSLARLGSVPAALLPRVQALLAEQGQEPPAALVPPTAEQQISTLRTEVTALAAELAAATTTLAARTAELATATATLAATTVARDAALAQVEPARQAGHTAGVAAERARIQAIEAHALTGHGALLAAAKFGRPATEATAGKPAQPAVEPLSPEGFALALLAEERGQRAAHLEHAQADADEATAEIRPSAAPRGNADEARLAHLIKLGAEAASTTRK